MSNRFPEMRVMILRWHSVVCGVALGLQALAGFAAETPTNPPPAWMAQPLSLADAIQLALQENRSIRKARHDIEATHGVAIQTRAIVLPKLRALGDYESNDAIEKLPLPPNIPEISIQSDQRWSAGLRLVQSVYEGGRMGSALRRSRLLKDQAVFLYQRIVADTLLDVRTAYYDVLMAERQIQVREASTNLLGRELQDAERRYKAGVAQRYNVLRAEVELANAVPTLVRAKNQHRLAKNRLAYLVGYRVPDTVWEDIPLRLSGTLETAPLDLQLEAALGLARERRPELGAFRLAANLRQEDVVQAKSGYKPSVQLFGGYGWRSSTFSQDLTRDVEGWNAGAQLTWDIFDGLLTQGRIREAEARLAGARVEIEDMERRIETEVRAAYSQYVEAREVLASQAKVVEQAEEAVRLATVQKEAGSSTQLDLLGAQTALTEARTIRAQALRDHAAAQAALWRAIGELTTTEPTKPADDKKEPATPSP